MAEASLACRLVSLMPFASDCFQPGPVNSHDPGASRQARLWFYGADSPHQPQTTMSNSNWVRTQFMETYTIFVSNQRGALNPRPKGRGTSRALGRRRSQTLTLRLRSAVVGGVAGSLSALAVAAASGPRAPLIVDCLCRPQQLFWVLALPADFGQAVLTQFSPVAPVVTLTSLDRRTK